MEEDKRKPDVEFSFRQETWEDLEAQAALVC